MISFLYSVMFCTLDAYTHTHKHTHTRRHIQTFSNSRAKLVMIEDRYPGGKRRKGGSVFRKVFLLFVFFFSKRHTYDNRFLVVKNFLCIKKTGKEGERKREEGWGGA